MDLSIAGIQLDGRALQRRAVLDPVAELLEEVVRLAAGFSPTMTESGSLEIAVKVMDFGDDACHGVVVLFGGPGMDDVVSL